jgi:hypothetical protein
MRRLEVVLCVVLCSGVVASASSASPPALATTLRARHAVSAAMLRQPKTNQPSGRVGQKRLRSSLGTVDLASDYSFSPLGSDPSSFLNGHVSLRFRITDVGKVGKQVDGSVALSGSLRIEQGASGCAATYVLLDPRPDYDVIRIFHVKANTYAVKLVYQGNLHVTFTGPCGGGAADSPFGVFLEFKVASKTPTLAGEVPLAASSDFGQYEEEVSSETSSRVRANSWTLGGPDIGGEVGAGTVSYSIPLGGKSQPQATCTGSPGFGVSWVTPYSARFRTTNGKGVKASRWRFLNKAGGQIGLVDGLTARFKFPSAGRYHVNHTIANSCNQIAKATKTLTVPGG